MGTYTDELIWDKNKQKMVKVRKKVEIDGLVGTEEEKEVSDTLLQEYIENDYFRKNEFNLRKLDKEIPLVRRDRDVSVDVYLKFLDDYLNRLRNGRKPDKSYFVSAPDGFGKKMFVYQAIKESLRHGLKPTKLLATHELYEYLDRKEYNQFYKNFQDVDLAFITLGGAPTITDLIVIKTALDYCERIGVPLLAISRFDPQRFHKHDVLSITYLGVKVAKRGDFGVMELVGFNMAEMNMIKDEMRKKLM